MRSVAVFNAGSSSLKWAVFQGRADAAPRRLAGATVATDEPVTALEKLAGQPDGPFAAPNLAGFGHRIVHGGPDLATPVRVDAAALAAIEAVEPLAPLHNPPTVALLRAVAARRPDLPQVACFDTAFHRGHSAIADRFAIPEALHRQGVRRYGFHGLSYEFIAGHLPEAAPAIAGGRVVVAHLGAGASMCALVGGRSVESTMSLTPLDGLPMATRPGSLDPGLVLWLLRQKGWSAERVEHFLYHECGLAGLSGESGDIRALLASATSAARLAVEYFVQHVAVAAGALAVAMGGIDGLVFTGGIGEHSTAVRAGVLDRLEWLGFATDPAANARGGPLLTKPGSARPAYALATDEEAVIARHTLALL
jgi:acetate kinase